MHTSEFQAMLDYCDELTKDGKKIYVTWKGCCDNSWLQLWFDGREIQEPSAIEFQILDHVGLDNGLASFNGDDYPEGRVVYNRTARSFEIDYSN